MSAPATAANAHFVEKWLQREPGMRFSAGFCPPALRPRFYAWGSLLNELRETMFDLSEASVAQLKISWWAEELLGVGRGQHRHPLTASLLDTSAPWAALSRALLDFEVEPRRAANTAQAIAALATIAGSASAVEAHLFAASRSAPASQLALHWLTHRLPHGLASADQGRVPMHLFARHATTAEQVAAGGSAVLIRDWAGELLQATEPTLGGTALIARSRARSDRQRLQRLAAGKGFDPPGAVAMLWQAWQAARET